MPRNRSDGDRSLPQHVPASPRPAESPAQLRASIRFDDSDGDVQGQQTPVLMGSCEGTGRVQQGWLVLCRIAGTRC
jgi:hypothetical protein